MALIHEITEISDEDEEFGDGSTYNLDDIFLNEDVAFETLSGAEGNSHTNGARPSNMENVFDGYPSCLREVLEIFPDISHEHVQQLYNKHMAAMVPAEQREGIVAQALIEAILDGGRYPKEKDRMKELKRKRNDKETDEEEAAKWKQADLRDPSAEYAKVVYVQAQSLSLFRLVNRVLGLSHTGVTIVGDLSCVSLVAVEAGSLLCKSPMFKRSFLLL